MSALFFLTALAELVLAALTVYFVLRVRYLRRERDELLQEKQVIFGFVHDVAEVFADASGAELDPMLKRVLFYALRTTRAGAGAIYLFEPDDELLRCRAISGVFPPLLGGVDTGLERAMSKSQHVESLVKSKLIHRGEGLVGDAADFGHPILIEDAEPDPRVPRYEVDFLRIHSLLLVPMRFHQKVLGVLAVVNRVDGTPFIQADLNLLQALADQASVSIHYAGLRETLDEKHQIDHDLGVARRIQMSLLPKALPKMASVEVSAFNYPAQEIGGDYYDFVQVDDTHLGIAIADVSGKGIVGAIMMSVCRSVLRAHAPRNRSPAQVLRLLNQVLSQDVSEDMFVSMLYMVLDTATRQLTVARAGHERPILSSGDGRGFTILDSPGIAIGISDTATFERVLQEVTIPLNAGDVVVAYTDGVTEAMNLQGEEWGVDNFLDAVRVAAEEGAHSVLNNVRQRLERFVGSRPQYDDMTLLALRAMR
jgi:phosphoserine phosphatase RsbU/P